ncbi:hypothetical protein MHYP_G00018680 [Metynnis hypsauchen]
MEAAAFGFQVYFSPGAGGHSIVWCLPVACSSQDRGSRAKIGESRDAGHGSCKPPACVRIISRVDQVASVIMEHCWEVPEFQKTMSVIDPRYELPGLRYFSRTAIPELYGEARERVEEQLKSAAYFATTADLWSSRTSEPDSPLH